MSRLLLAFCRSGVGLLVAAGAAFVAAPTLHAERPLLADELPEELNGVGIVERLNETVPLQLDFVDDKGRPVTIGELFHENRPVILTLNYYRCPMLCSMTLNGMVEGLNGIDWSAGTDFDIITVSIAPEEGPELANVKKRAYLTQYDRKTAAEGWHFLTGDKKNIDALAKATGFGYRKVEKDNEYAHTSSIIFVTPDGRISRYMNDVLFQPKDLRLALVEASEGAIGSPMDKFLLFMCYHYDPEAGSYSLAAWKMMRMGGVLTIMVIGAGLIVLWRRGPQYKQTDVPLGGLQP